MFWGLNLKANRKYTQKTTKSFHISLAALDYTSTQSGATQVFLTHEDQKYLICTLRKDICEQVSLDLNFAEGDEISFQTQGNGNVTLSGYLVEDDSSFYDTEFSDELSPMKKKHKKKSKNDTVTDEDDEDDDEDDSDINGGLQSEEDNSSDDEEQEEEEEEEEEGEEQESEDESEDMEEPKPKQVKLDQKKQNGTAKQINEKNESEKQSKKSKKEKKGDAQKGEKVEKTLQGGLKIEDLKVGNGPEVKVGKRVSVYYEGRLKSNNKVFDSVKQGAGFKFPVGAGKVIKGWDIGVVGMKVGGKRRIICPPHMGYGNRGAPPTIPPNSTLVFEVELKSVN